MRFAGFPDEAFEFYEGLQADNSKAYWTDHKATWETCIRDPMNALVDELQPEIGGDVKVFRPYRDVRFAADKSPYKTNQGAMINDAKGESGLYVHIDADGLLVATGYYQTSSDQVERYRAAVLDDTTGPRLVDIVEGLRGDGYLIEGDRMKTRPRGVPEDHPRVDLLRHRSLIAHRMWEPAAWMHTRRTLNRIRQAWERMAPLNEWLTDNVGASRQPQPNR
jgi:uncharacterized protein (TIGR02453 family)